MVDLDVVLLPLERESKEEILRAEVKRPLVKDMGFTLNPSATDTAREITAAAAEESFMLYIIIW
jgi:hypothetical protein